MHSAREPDLGQTHSDLPKAAKGRAPATFAVTVPVYFHVITGRRGRPLSHAQQIDAQIAVLNKTFGGREGGSRTGFAFALAGVTHGRTTRSGSPPDRRSRA
jgi:hypothetical protein